MSFLNPSFLWALLAALPLAAVYLLKVKPRAHQTNAWFLWKKIYEEKQSSSLFSKFRHLLSLLLLLLMLLLVVLAVADPKIGNADQEDIVLLMDRSASMGTLDGQRTRLDKAKADAHELIRSLRGHQLAMVAVVDEDLNFITDLTRNSKQLHNAIDEISLSALPLNGEALTELTSLAGGEKSGSRLIFLSDGCGKLPANLTNDLEVINYHGPSNNVGLVAADIRRIPGDGSPARCMVQLVSAMEQEIEVELEAVHTETSAIGKIMQTKVKPGVNAPVFFDLPSADDGPWEINLLRDDALKIDNQLALVLQSRPAVPIGVMANDSYFYERCIEAFDHGAQGGSGLTLTSIEQADLCIGEGGQEDLPTDRDLLLFAPQGTSPYWSNVADLIEIGLVIKPEDHPAVRHLDSDFLSFAGARQLDVPEGARIRLEADDGTPLFYQIREAERTVFVANLDPAEGDFFLSPWFPILVYDVATYLGGADMTPASLYPTGSRVRFSQTDEVEMEDPLGNRTTLTANGQARLDEKGLYTIDAPQRDYSLAASLLSIAESGQQGGFEGSEVTSVIAPFSLAFWMIVLAIIILVVESIMYHRRKVG